MIKAIFFDIGKVLVDFRERKDVLRSIVAHFRGDPSELSKLFEDASGEKAYRRLDSGSMGHYELWQFVCRQCKISPHDLQLHLFTALYVEHLKPIEPMIAIARRLENKFSLAAISNGDFGSVYAVHMLEAFRGIRFEWKVLSSSLGEVKPKLIEWARDRVTRRLACLPNECLYVDDLLGHIEAARALGLNAIQHDGSAEPPELFKAKLRDFDIVV